MPHTKNNKISIPSSGTKIWRFMDFTKYVSLLEKKAIFFCRSDLFDDPFEGAVSRPALESIKMWDMVDDFMGSMRAEEVALKTKEYLQYHYLNCWHINEHESAAMWKLYSKTEESVAIQSRVGRLGYSFNNVRQNVIIGSVNYIDYDVVETLIDDHLMPFFYKRKSFEHEKELRAIISNIPNDKGTDNSLIESPGFNLPVDIESLIEEVYVSPSSSKWFRQLVKSVTKKFGVELEIQNSRLDETPVY